MHNITVHFQRNKTSIQRTPDVKFWSKMIFEQQNQENFRKKNFFSEKNLGKIKFGNKIFEKKLFWKKFEKFLEKKF